MFHNVHDEYSRMLDYAPAVTDSIEISAKMRFLEGLEVALRIKKMSVSIEYFFERPQVGE